MPAARTSASIDLLGSNTPAGARNKGMSDAMFKELMAVVGMANETNRLVAGYQVAIDDRFKV